MLNALRSQLRTIWTVLQHSFTRAETVQYPEQKPYLAPRYRGRIVLTRDPDGEERCVACNLCAVACPVDCISMQAAEAADGRRYAAWFRINFSRCIFCDIALVLGMILPATHTTLCGARPLSVTRSRNSLRPSGSGLPWQA